MRISIRWKLAGTYFIMIVLTLLLADWLAYTALKDHYLQEREDAYRVHTNVVGTYAGEYILGEYMAMPTLIRDYGNQVDARVVLLNRQGYVVGDSFNEQWIIGMQLKHPEVQAALRGETASGTQYVSDEEWVMYISVPVTRQKEVVGAVLLSTDITDIGEALDSLLRRMVLFSLLGGMLAGLIGLWLSVEVTRPVQELTEAVERVAMGNLDQRVPVHSRDELGQLAKAFNTMAIKLARFDRTRQEFIANASHELKSPLSSIKALAESLTYGDERDVVVYKEYLNDINSEVDRLNRLVHDLLKLAQLEDENTVLQKELQSISDIIQRIVNLMKPQAKLKEISLRAYTPEDIFWPVDRDTLSGVLLNLVDNGIKYTPPGGRVEVECQSQGEELVIRVADTGEGIPPEELPLIFERFYRVDKARARQTGGTGLGLSIVEEGVKLLGGTISVESEPARGTVFTINLPK
ncbi:sensor histidine kinase [Desulfofalx alkaliphila]|uniref:sensor histidine kinase n=1 Tax=Desulfofalx alkaliphila TaxID=105483 RepID=UPI00068F8A12|nr:ATP-binding protein [Desulfofalx alkaliphila]